MSEVNPIAVKRLIEPEQLRQDLRFSVADLTTAMMNQASLATHYGLLAAKATRQVNDLALALEVAEGKVYRKLRDEAAAGGAKPVVSDLTKAVALDPRIIALQKAINEAKQVEGQAKTAVEAFRQRRDMLVQAGLLSREEMKGEVSIARRQEVEATREVERKALASKIAHTALSYESST